MISSQLHLPLLAAGQAQKHVTVNEALIMLDDLVQLSALSATLDVPPAAPAEGARYLVGATPTGAWAGQAHAVAVVRDGNWEFHQPHIGWTAYVADEEQMRAFDGAVWRGTRRLGVNATASAVNRLSVASPASLFNHEGQGHQLKINKAAAGDTASILFQTGFAGRAEMGLAGTDGFSFKVSPDGTSWSTALTIDPATALVSLPGAPDAAARRDLLVNGDFAINQRGFAGGALAANQYGFDRWRAGAAGASLQLAAGVVTLASGAVVQTIEAALWGLASFASETLTVSLDNPTAPVSVTLGGVSGTIPAGSGRCSATLTLPAGAGATVALQLSASGSVSFARVKLERGNGATRWVPRPVTEEQQLAKRYFQRLSGPLYFFMSAGAVGSYFFNYIPLTVTMRATPAVSRVLTSYSNIYQNNTNEASTTAPNASLLQIYIRSHTVGEAYATFASIDCNAEFIS